MTESEATQGKWKLWLPIVISILIIVPLLYFFWSKWKFVLVLIVIGAIIVGILLLVKQLNCLRPGGQKCPRDSHR